MVISLWDSDAAVGRFAGPEPNRAVFYPDDLKYLVERDQHVDHFEVVFARLPSRSLLRRAFGWWFEHWKSVVRDVPKTGWPLSAFR